MANIRLLVETLDVESSEGVALGSMLGRDRLYFEVPLPTTGASYQVRVLSVEYLRHWAMRLEILGAAMVMKSSAGVASPSALDSHPFHRPRRPSSAW